MFETEDIVSSYTADQAVEDGFLVDVTAQAKETGFKWPVRITIGVHRIITGDSIHHYIIGGYILVIFLTWLAPKYIVPLAFDLGGVTTSEVTVPLVTALGIGLASQIDGRNVLIDGFGLIAFASIFPIVTVMLYAIVMEQLARRRKTSAHKVTP